MPDELLQRIEAVDLARPCLDSGRIEEAISQHLELLGLERRPLRLAGGIGPGCALCSAERDDLEWLRARARARRATGIRAVGQAFRPVALWDEVAAAAHGGILGDDGGLRPNPVGPWLGDALLAAAAPYLPESEPVVRWRQACLALVDAYEAGLGFFWILEDEIVAVPRPALSLTGWQLHDETGPAITWADGECRWFWHGIRVSRATIEAPESLTAAEVVAERNLERRRVMLDRMGYERYLATAGGSIVATDSCGRLWRCDALPGEREPLFLVEVENATREPDGSTKRYFLRVPPSTTTPHQAVAWTFGIDPTRYAPLAES